MIKPPRQPYGFRQLLAYKKADELQAECSRLTSCFPRLKTILALADQMNRSARSTKQNIVEGWKRNSTKEYYEFLGFSIGANTELEEDCNDIWKIRYPELIGLNEIMGERGVMGERGEKGTPFTSSTPSSSIVSSTVSPSSAPTPFIPSSSIVSSTVSPSSAIALSTPFSIPTPSIPTPTPTPTPTPSSLYGSPLPPFDIEKLLFYPLNKNLPPIVQLKLRCKELNFLLNQLQKSLEQKMKEEKTLPRETLARKRLEAERQNEKWEDKLLKQHGLERLENGQVIQKK